MPTVDRSPVRLGLVGYGDGGRLFHAPFIEAADGIEVVGVVSRDPGRRRQLAEDLPGTPAYDGLAQLLDAGVDAVTITTPPETRRALVLQALDGGVHVVADKPFALNAASGRELARRADESGLLLSVYHNRRWDADLRTLAEVITSGQLGEVWRVHNRLDLDEPQTLDAGPDGGLLRDLGSHLLDQLRWLLGPVTSVSAHLDYVPDPEPTDAGFVVTLQHASGAVSYAEASKANRIAARELRAYGSQGSYQASGTDVQASAVRSGRRPAEDPAGWGREPFPGLLTNADGPHEVASARGAYQDFYTGFAAAVRGEGRQPVPAVEGVRTLILLDAARTSAATGEVVHFAHPE